MKRDFFKYFLLTYFVLIAGTGPFLFSIEADSWLEKTGIIFLILLGIAIILAPISYWLTPKLKIRYRRRKTKKRLFQEFIKKHHFRVTDDGFVFGKIDDFIIFMFADYDEFQSTKWIEIQILFHPKQKEQFIIQSFFQRMIRKYEGKNVTWHLNSVLIQKSYALKLPTYEDIFPLIKKCVSELKAYHILPITYKEWQHMISETQQHSNTLEKL